MSPGGNKMNCPESSLECNYLPVWGNLELLCVKLPHLLPKLCLDYLSWKHYSLFTDVSKMDLCTGVIPNNMT